MVDSDSAYHEDESGSESDNIPDQLTVETSGGDEALEEMLQLIYEERSTAEVPTAETTNENILDPLIVETWRDDEAFEELLRKFIDEEDSNTLYPNVCREVSQDDSGSLDEDERTILDPAAAQVSIPSVGPPAAAQVSIPPTDSVADQHERPTISTTMQRAEYQVEILTILRGYFPGRTDEQLIADTQPLIASLDYHCQTSNFDEYREFLHQSLKHMLFPKPKGANDCTFSDRSVAQVTELPASVQSSRSKKRKKPRAAHYMCPEKCGQFKIHCACQKKKARKDVEVQDSSTQTDAFYLR
jgi:hypothetical protein